MAPTTAVHCPGCGFDNQPQYKYCGMCGTALSGAPQSKSVRRQDAPLTVGGYSTLGLAQDPISSAMPAAVSRQAGDQQNDSLGSLRSSSPNNYPPRRDPQGHDRQEHDFRENDLLSRNLDYLFEDDKETTSPRWRLYLALTLLGIAAAALVWQWQRNGYPWNDLTPLTSERNAGAAPAVSAPVASVNPNAVQTPAANPGTDATPKPEAGLASQATEPASATPESLKSESLKPEAAQPEPVNSELTSPVPQKTPQLKPVSETQPNASAAHPPDAAESASGQEKGARSPLTAPTSSAAPEQVAPAVESSESSANAPSDIPAAPEQPSSPSEAAALLAEGTRYLYGNGVAQDCYQAQKDLLAAAHFSSDAESMLGTMYGSGHCVARDLPTAYRWYARALHSKPQNTRIQNDVTVLWNQMTPAERKAATRSGP
jgi:outer membrane biosynthesis protein TonB